MIIIKLYIQLHFSKIYNNFLNNSYDHNDIYSLISCISDYYNDLSRESITLILSIPVALLKQYDELFNNDTLALDPEVLSENHKDRVYNLLSEEALNSSSLEKYRNMLDKDISYFSDIAELVLDTADELLGSEMQQEVVDVGLMVLNSLYTEAHETYIKLLDVLNPDDYEIENSRIESFGVIFARKLEKAFDC